MQRPYCFEFSWSLIGRRFSRSFNNGSFFPHVVYVWLTTWNVTFASIICSLWDHILEFDTYWSLIRSDIGLIDITIPLSLKSRCSARLFPRGALRLSNVRVHINWLCGFYWSLIRPDLNSYIINSFLLCHEVETSKLIEQYALRRGNKSSYCVTSLSINDQHLQPPPPQLNNANGLYAKALRLWKLY